MGEVSTIGLDIARNVFQAHGVDASGRVVFRKKIARRKLVEFFATQPFCMVGFGSMWRRSPLGTRDQEIRARCSFDTSCL